jgi:hypothetical protein
MVDCERWINETEKYHSTINDIIDIKIGETKIFLCIDRNFDEIINESDLCKNNYYMVFTKIEGINGNMDIFCGIDEAHKEITNRKNPNYKYTRDEELHVNYTKKHWYPFQDGVFHVIDSQTKRTLIKGNDMSWQEFPKKTKVGWRGPMIDVKYIDEVKIYPE